MTYVPDTPQDQPSPAATQAQIQTNFAQFALKFLVNHSAMNTSSQGDHQAVVLQNQSADPGVTQDQVTLFCKNATSQAGTQPQLFAQIKKFLPTLGDPRDAPNDGMQLTYNAVNTAGPNQFQSFLIGGYLLHFGTVTALGTVTLSPAPSQIIIAIAQPNNMTTVGTPIANTVSTQVLNNSQFNILSSTATGIFSFTWLTISRA